MSLSPGMRVGSYEVTGSLGVGGMGEVYRARDTQLKRDIALKVLPPSVARDPERLARFQREAELLAALNHSNIARIYGIADADGVRALVMELVEGVTLAEQIAAGPLPLPDAVRIARQLADALDYAHERGIVHRDLKPGNIMVTADGRVKVLDFGLAKAMAVDAQGGVVAGMANSPTITSPAMTAAGLILGTAAYMSPEQARGKPVDKRADIWAFGVVFYEMLTGRAAFPGESITDVLGAILHKEVDWTRLPQDLPPHQRRLIERCLQKDLRARLRDIGDVHLELDAAAPSVTPASTPSVPRRRAAILAVVLAGVLVGAAGFAIGVMRVPAASGTAPIRLSIDPPPGTTFDVLSWAGVGLAPDGKSVVFGACGPDGSHLYVRDFDGFAARQLPGTEDAIPAFLAVSADGQSVQFMTSATELKQVAMSGRSEALLVAPGADWFVSALGWRRNAPFVTANRDLWVLPTPGAPWQRVSTINPDDGEGAFVSSVVLPSGLVLTSVNTRAGTRVAAVGDDNQRRWVADATGNVRGFIAPDGVVLQRDGRLFVARLDEAALRVGAAHELEVDAPATADVAIAGGTAAYFYSLRGKGSRLVLVDRDGRATPIPAEPGEYRAPRFSPNGRSVAVYGTGTSTSNSPISFSAMTIDLQTGTRIQVPAVDALIPVWDATGSALLMASGQGLPQQVVRWNASGTAGPEVAFTTPFRSGPYQWLPNGDVLIEAMNPSQDIAVVNAQGQVRWLLTGPRAERFPRLSPDGRWLAYMSNESGRFEVYVQSWPALDRKHAVSRDGGAEPVWSHDGRELYFRRGRSLMVSRVAATAEFRSEAPFVLFNAGRYSADPWGDPSFDVDAKGRFIMIEDDPSARTELRVELHVPGATGSK